MPWNYRQYASATDPVHKSHLNSITGDYGCPAQFRYSMDDRAERGIDYAEERETVPAKAACGTAAHETIARALSSQAMRVHLLAGGSVQRGTIAKVFDEELQRECGGRELLWFDKDAAEIVADRVSMICGVLNTLHRYAAEIVLVEPGFVAKLDDYWLSGHLDLVFRPRSNPRAIAIADWKTGEHKPHVIELAHGWEGGLYSAAVKLGVFLPREQLKVTAEPDGKTTVSVGHHTVSHASRYIAERTVLERAMIDLAQLMEAGDVPPDAAPNKLGLTVVGFGDFPVEIWHVHAHDFVPYRKAGRKAVKRPEDLAWYGYETAQRAHAYSAGEQRGPGWLPVGLTEHDLPRLGHRLRAVVGSIRMGRFLDQVGERCSRCPYSRQCLTTGYAPRTGGTEERGLRAALRQLDTADADAADLNTRDD
jgi:hypothetical protein